VQIAIAVENLPILLKGALHTVQVSLGGILIGIVVGWLFGLLSVSHSKLLRSAAWVYVSFIRGTPLLVQILLLYFGLAAFAGIDLPAFWAGALALGLNSGGYQSEIIRAGVESVDRGQIEAARSIGLSHRKTLLRILVPQTIRRVTPPLTNELISLTKSSSLLSVIAVPELTHQGAIVIARTFTPFEIYLVVALIYLVIITVLSQVSAYLEHHVFINY
jgi:polar amino acid transport system permease protein